MDVGDGWQEAQRADAARVRETRGAAKERERSDRYAVLAKQAQSCVGAIKVRRGSERCGRVLHLHDDRQNGEGIGLHARPQGGIDLLVRKHLGGGLRRGTGEYLRKHEKRVGNGNNELSSSHVPPVGACSLPRSSRSGMLKQNVLPWPWPADSAHIRPPWAAMRPLLR